MLTCDTYCHTWYSLWHIRYTRSVHDNKCRMWAFIRVRCITSLFHTWHIFTSYYAHVDMAATAFKHSDFKTSFSIKETVLNYNCVSRCTIMMYPLKYFETNVSAFRIKQSLHIDELQNFIWFFFCNSGILNILFFYEMRGKMMVTSIDFCFYSLFHCQIEFTLNRHTSSTEKCSYQILIYFDK